LPTILENPVDESIYDDIKIENGALTELCYGN
jgi:hypothetical protein